MILLLVSAVVLRPGPHNVLTSTLFLSLVILSGVFAAGARRAFLVPTVALSIPALLIGWLQLTDGLLLTARYGCLAGVLVLTLGSLLRHMMQTRHVNADLVYASLCGYFLLGFLWASLFILVELSDAGAFRPSLFADGPARHFESALYFSLVTLSTLGYGDIIPESTGARLLAASAALTGQVYLAIVIARVVGLHISAQSDDESAA